LEEVRPEVIQPKQINKPPSKTISIPSFSELRAQVNKPEETVDGEVIEESLGRKEEFTIADLDKVWEEFKSQKEKDNNPLELLILKEPYRLIANIITVSISNGASEASFERFRGDLLIAIRDGLKNDSIQLKSETIAIEREKMLYTDQEKFEHLKKKYPALKDLQERLGLDPEF
jgi:DNA polymerase-3 subunit gamma/tau